MGKNKDLSNFPNGVTFDASLNATFEGNVTADAFILPLGLATEFLMADGSKSSGTVLDDEAYGVSWNGSVEAPTKNALWDKIETLGAGSVTAISIATANGFAGSSSGGATPILTLSTSVTGILYGNGSSMAAAIAANFPILNQSTTGNASTVTTNANLTGPVTSVGNATSIADAALSIAKTSGLQTALNGKQDTLSGTGIVKSTGGTISYLTDPLPIANGGTGSATKNFVDLTTTQTIAGTKNFDIINTTGLITSGTALSAGSSLNLNSSGTQTWISFLTSNVVKANIGWDNANTRLFFGTNSHFTGTGIFTSSVTASAFFESSDKTIKTLIATDYIIKGIEDVKSQFYIKDGREELGYFAQDLQEILPSSVTIGANKKLNLSYREVHTAKIAYLENRVAELESKLKNR